MTVEDRPLSVDLGAPRVTPTRAPPCLHRMPLQVGNPFRIGRDGTRGRSSGNTSDIYSNANGYLRIFQDHRGWSSCAGVTHIHVEEMCLSRWPTRS